MKIICSVLALSVLFVFCSAGTLELEERELIEVIGIDAKDGVFELSAKSDDEDISYKADTLPTAFSIEGKNQPYFGLTKVCVIGEDILKDKDLFSQSIQYLEENTDISRKIILVCCDTKAKSILKAMEESNEIYEYYEVNKNHYKRYLEDIIQDTLCQNSTIIPFIDETLIPSGAVILKNNEYLSKIDSTELNGFIELKKSKKAIYEQDNNIIFNVYAGNESKESIEKAFRYMLEGGADLGISEYIRRNYYDIFSRYNGEREEILQRCRLKVIDIFG